MNLHKTCKCPVILFVLYLKRFSVLSFIPGEKHLPHLIFKTDTKLFFKHVTKLCFSMISEVDTAEHAHEQWDLWQPKLQMEKKD